MSRKELPKTFLGQKLLQKTIKKKVDNDAANGELVAFLVDHGIDLVADTVLVTAAGVEYTSFLAFKKQSEKLCAQRDKLLNPVVKSVTGSVQFLKAYYQPDYKSLGDWDVVVTDGGKVTIATDPELFLTFLIAFKAENDTYTGLNISPLAQYLTKNKIDLAQCVTDTTAAVVIDDNFKIAKSNSEDAHQVMETKSALPFANLTLITNFLMKLYAGDEKGLSDYGIKVINAPKADKVKNIKLALGQSKLKVKTRIGSMFFNTGTVDLNIYKGKTISGDFIVLAAGAKLLVPKGYSKFSVYNPSTTTTGKLQLIPKQIVMQGG